MKQIKRFRNIFALIAFLLLLMTTVSAETMLASGYCGGEGDGTNLTWTLTEDGTLTISGSGAMEDYNFGSWGETAPWYEHRESIKEVLIGNKVTRIGGFAFYFCENLSKVVIPNGVKELGFRALSECHNLAEITLPNSLVSIEDYAFSSSYSLVSVAIPASVTEIGGFMVFDGCSSLTEITVDDKNPTYCDEDGVLFNKDKTVLMRFPEGKSVDAYVVPEGVTVIGYNAFRSVRYVDSVTLPEGLAEIQGWAFEMSALSSVNIPESVTSIGWNAFRYCNNLSSVRIPAAVTTIGDIAFNGCGNLPEIVVDANNPVYCSEDGILFDKKMQTLICYPAGKPDTSYVVPDSVTKIESNAFAYTDDLVFVTVPDSVITIGEDAFSCCNMLDTVIIGKNVTTIGARAFNDYCDRSVLFTGDPPKIFEYTFSNVTELFYLKGTSGWTTDEAYNAENSTWNGCDLGIWGYCGGEGDGTNLIWTLHPKGTLTISGEGAMAEYEYDYWKQGSTAPWFDYKEQISRVLIETGVTTIGDYAFDGLTALIFANIGDDVEIIGDCAFAGSKKMVRVDMGSSVSEICYSAFSGCDELARMIIPDSVKIIGSHAFEACIGLESITVGSGVESIGECAFNNCNILVMDAVYISDLEAWCKIDFADLTANPLHNGKNLYLNGTKVTELVFPDGLTEVKPYAFTNIYVDEVVIGDDVTKVADSAFWGCHTVKKLTLGKNIADIEDMAFWYNWDLDEVIFLENVSSIGAEAFAACDNLTAAYFRGNAPEVYAAEDEKHTFEADVITLYYIEGTTGWTDSEFYDAEAKTWKGYNLAVWEGEEPEDPEEPKDPEKPEKPEDPNDGTGNSKFPWWLLLGGRGLPFADIKTGDWFYDDVEYVYFNDLMNGTSDTVFSPMLHTTRGMIVTILYRMEGEPPVSYQSTFADVADGQWYTDAVLWATNSGIVNGYGNGSFGPDDSITREQLATILYRYAKATGVDTSARRNLMGYADSGTVGSWAYDAMSWANAVGLISGRTEMTLAPQQPATRAELAAILHRFCERT